MTINTASDTKASLTYYHCLTARWFLLPNIILFASFLYFNKELNPVFVLLTQSPYLLISISVHVLLMKSPRRGRIVAMWTPLIVMLLTALFVILDAVAEPFHTQQNSLFGMNFAGTSISLSCFIMSLIYIICLIPIYIF